MRKKRVVLGLCFGWMFLLMGLISMESRLPQLFVYNEARKCPPPQQVGARIPKQAASISPTSLKRQEDVLPMAKLEQRRYNATASVPVGWYLLLPPQNVARDDMVVFTVPEDMQALAVERGWLPKGTKMLKRVGGMAGDMYGINRSRQFYLNDVYIGQASLVDASTVEGTPHIYLKPIAKGAKTNIIINTTHHTYHVECVTLLQRKES